MNKYHAKYQIASKIDNIVCFYKIDSTIKYKQNIYNGIILCNWNIEGGKNNSR